MAQSEGVMTPVRRFFRLLQLDKKDITYIYVYAIFGGLINLSLPVGVQAIIGLVAGGALSASIFLLVGAVTIGTALVGVLRVMQLTVTESIQRRIFARSSFDFAYRLPRFRSESLTDAYVPELVNRFFDTVIVQKGLPKILMDFSTSALQILFGLVLIAFYHPFFAFFGLFLIFFVAIIFYITGPGGLKTSLKESSMKYMVASWLEEIGRSRNTFKLAGGQSLALDRTDHLVNGYLDRRASHFRVLLNQYGFMVAFKVVVTASLLLLGGNLVIQNQITIGQFVAAEIVIILVISSVEKLILTMDVIYDTLTGLEKIGTVMDRPLEPHGGQSFSDIDIGKGMMVRARDLHFQYPTSNGPSLQNINLDIKPLERICIAGYNAAGKSTLLGVVGSMFTTVEGQLTYNNVPFQDLDLRDLRQYIGDYSMSEDIVEGTILDNITLCHPMECMPEVISAVQAVGLEEEIATLPNGYGTQLLPAGSNVSRSMRTRIMVARAILSKPRLLLVEGYFPGLEASERSRVYDLLTSKDRPWTLITVTDDAELAGRCDRVIVLQDGKIVQEGTMEDISQGPHFKNIFHASPVSVWPATV